MKTAHDKWDSENTIRVNMKLNKKTDHEIIAWLEKQDSKQGAIKKAILEYIKSSK